MKTDCIFKTRYFGVLKSRTLKRRLKLEEKKRRMRRVDDCTVREYAGESRNKFTWNFAGQAVEQKGGIRKISEEDASEVKFSVIKVNVLSRRWVNCLKTNKTQHTRKRESNEREVEMLWQWVSKRARCAASSEVWPDAVSWCLCDVEKDQVSTNYWSCCQHTNNNTTHSTKESSHSMA